MKLETASLRCIFLALIIGFSFANPTLAQHRSLDMDLGVVRIYFSEEGQVDGLTLDASNEFLSSQIDDIRSFESLKTLYIVEGDLRRQDAQALSEIKSLRKVVLQLPSRRTVSIFLENEQINSMFIGDLHISNEMMNRFKESENLTSFAFGNCTFDELVTGAWSPKDRVVFRNSKLPAGFLEGAENNFSQLEIDRCELDPSNFEFIKNCELLRLVDVGLTDDHLSLIIGNNPALKGLGISINLGITDQSGVELSNLEELEWLTANSTRIAGGTARELLKMKSLGLVEARGTSIPLDMLKKLQHLFPANENR